MLATGVTHSYFGHDEFAAHAPGLKTLADAVAIRNAILQAFEQAEALEDPSHHGELLTIRSGRRGPNRSRVGQRDFCADPQYLEIGISQN